MVRLLPTALLVLLALPAAWASGQDTLGDANAAFRRGDLRRAAELFAAAAAAEPDPARRAEIKVRLAVTYFNLGNRSKTEEALAAALDDQPTLELVPEFYVDDFLALFRRARARRQAPPPAPSPAAQASAVAATPASLAALRQRLAMAVDNAALEPLLAEVQGLEMATPPAGLADVVELKAEVLERLGSFERSLEERGRAAAIRAAVQALPGTSPVPLDALLEARRLIAGERAAEAAALSRGILAAIPTSAPALELLAEALLEAGRYDEAYSALKTAMVDREKPELMLLLGEVELRRDNLAAARDAFRRIADLDPGHDRANAALGLIAARLGDLETAKQALDRALQANGTLVEARVARAQIALSRGDAAAAVADLQRALQMRPDDRWVSGWLGVAHLAAGNVAAAGQAMPRGGGTAEPHAFRAARAEAARRGGDPAACLAALADGDASGPATLLRARCLLDAGRHPEAMRVLQALVDRAPGDGAARFLLGYARYLERDWRGAAAELAQASGLAGAPTFTAEAVTRARATLAAQALLDGAVTPPAPAQKR